MPSELKKPEPVWYAIDTQGGEYDTIFTDSRDVVYQHVAQAQDDDPDIAEADLVEPLYTAAQLEQYAADRVREAEEAIADEYASRLQSDLEHGVRSLNEKAARDFNQTYMGLAGFMGWLNNRTLKEQTK